MVTQASSPNEPHISLQTCFQLIFSITPAQPIYTVPALAIAVCLHLPFRS
jgi:hypothetical protein